MVIFSLIKMLEGQDLLKLSLDSGQAWPSNIGSLLNFCSSSNWNSKKWECFLSPPFPVAAVRAETYLENWVECSAAALHMYIRCCLLPNNSNLSSLTRSAAAAYDDDDERSPQFWSAGTVPKLVVLFISTYGIKTLHYSKYMSALF